MERAIAALRDQLEAYIALYPAFRDSLVPIEPLPMAPPIALDMHRAAEATGVGPLAAVAGAMAEHAAMWAVGEGHRDVIVENGGDVFLHSVHAAYVSLYAGTSSLAHRVAFLVPEDRMPLAICSSSGVMGHSRSFGAADLVSVVAKSAAVADAAATAICNRVKTAGDIEPTLAVAMDLVGVDGVLIVVDGKIGMIGDLPELVRQDDSAADRKITKS